MHTDLGGTCVEWPSSEARGAPPTDLGGCEHQARGAPTDLGGCEHQGLGQGNSDRGGVLQQIQRGGTIINQRYSHSAGFKSQQVNG